MARACIRHKYIDGSETAMEFELDSSFPDAAAECVARVKDLWRETCSSGDEAEQP